MNWNYKWIVVLNLGGLTLMVKQMKNLHNWSLFSIYIRIYFLIFSNKVVILDGVATGLLGKDFNEAKAL